MQWRSLRCVSMPNLAPFVGSARCGQTKSCGWVLWSQMSLENREPEFQSTGFCGSWDPNKGWKIGEQIHVKTHTRDGKWWPQSYHEPRRCEMGILAYLLKPLSLCPNPSGIFCCVMTAEWHHPQSSRTFTLFFSMSLIDPNCAFLHVVSCSSLGVS